MRALPAFIGLLLTLATCTPQAVQPAPSRSVAQTAAPSTSSTASPTRTPSSPSPSAAAPTAVRFMDAQRGWIGTDDGILRTTNGGATWDRQLTGAAIVQIWSYDADHAWAIDAGKALYRTRDGTHWVPVVPQPNPPIGELDVFSADVLFAIGVSPTSVAAPSVQTGNVMRSEDGGATWQVVGTHTMWSVCFDTPTDGIGAEAKQIFRTADGGRTWSPIAALAINDDGPYWYPTLGCPNGTNDRVQVTEPAVGLGHAAYLVYRTTDGGRTWTIEFREGYTRGTTTPPNTPALGSYPSTFGALAGGRTWFITCSPPADTQEFLLLGATGETLARGPVPISACVRSGQVIDQSHVVAVAGSAAAVLMTDDGGTSWRNIYQGVARR